MSEHSASSLPGSAPDPAPAPRRVTIRIPASTANLGPGFDCLGLALQLFNILSVETVDLTHSLSQRESEQHLHIHVSGEGSDRLPCDERNLIYRAIKRFYQAIDRDVPPLRLRLENHIPLARGLGSSSAAIVGGLSAANALAGQPFSQSDLLSLAAKIEGHPDNVAPAIYGGLTVAVEVGDEIICIRCPVPPGIQAALFIPDFVMSTNAARKVLPRYVSRADAIFNLSRAAALVAAMATNQVQYLTEATRDRLHQPPRQKIFHAMADLFEAAEKAGALGVFLSGAGSTICALCESNAATVAQAMQAAGRELGVSGRAEVVAVAHEGAQVL